MRRPGIFYTFILYRLDMIVMVPTPFQVQLLPSWIGKRILSYLPQSELAQCAHVNSYWAYLVEELRAELAARSKIAVDIEKLQVSLFYTIL